MDRKYEVMFILRPDTSEEDLEKLLKTMESNVAATGGKVTGFDRALGKRRLAYTVKKFQEGIYILAFVEGTGVVLKELEGLALGPWASYRRQELLRMFDEMAAATTKLDQAVEQAAKNQPLAVRLMTHPGVGPVTSLAFVLIIGPVERFERSKQMVSYLGLNPQEHSSGGKQRMGSISKQGNPMMRSLLVEAGHTAARFDPELKRMYQRLKFRRGASVAKVAVARKLAVRMYWMLRSTADYAQLVRMQGSPWATLVENSPSLG